MLIDAHVKILDNAKVSGDAYLTGASVISENAVVTDTAYLEGRPKVFGNAWVGGSTALRGSASVSGSVKLSGYTTIDDSTIRGNVSLMHVTVQGCKTILEGDVSLDRKCWLRHIHWWMEIP